MCVVFKWSNILGSNNVKFGDSFTKLNNLAWNVTLLMLSTYFLVKYGVTKGTDHISCTRTRKSSLHGVQSVWRLIIKRWIEWYEFTEMHTMDNGTLFLLFTSDDMGEKKQLDIHIWSSFTAKTMRNLWADRTLHTHYQNEQKKRKLKDNNYEVGSACLWLIWWNTHDLKGHVISKVINGSDWHKCIK